MLPRELPADCRPAAGKLRSRASGGECSSSASSAARARARPERPDAARRSASLGFESLDATRPGTRRLGAVLPAGSARRVDRRSQPRARDPAGRRRRRRAGGRSRFPAPVRHAGLPATRPRGARGGARRARVRRRRRRPLRRPRPAARRGGGAAPARAPVALPSRTRARSSPSRATTPRTPASAATRRRPPSPCSSSRRRPR